MKLVLEELWGNHANVPSIEKKRPKLYTPSILGARLVVRWAVCNAVNPPPTSKRGTSCAAAFKHRKRQLMVVMEMTLPNLRILFRDHTAKIDRANKHRGRMNCSILYFSSSDLLVKVRQETPKAQASLPPQWSIGRMAICQLRGT